MGSETPTHLMRRINKGDPRAPDISKIFGNMLTTAQAAFLLNVSHDWLRNARRGMHDGPPWYHFGPKTIRYRREDIENFMKERLNWVPPDPETPPEN